ncbi:hypothetical protein BJY54_006954 [Streptomyces nodosus]|uniref:Uncharacterized protein n=1 Tax=Streptomyces nodosus TaxID=40318 RepID=A0A5P2VUE6_9ACTN|nr:hypothetical protein [Streptomyces nodosus]MBB4796250.1 hypothetical protein [Streptomyces nodosus]QEV37210.1 hypothetical protein CP978_00090 [Streptomyces nodosus]
MGKRHGPAHAEARVALATGSDPRPEPSSLISPSCGPHLSEPATSGELMPGPSACVPSSAPSALADPELSRMPRDSSSRSETTAHASPTPWH